MTTSQEGPTLGWNAFVAVFEQYHEINSTYIEAQEAFFNGVKTNTDALEHYSHAYELWLDAWKQMVRTDLQSDGQGRTTQYPASIPLKSVRQSTGPTDTDTSESTPIVDERVATLERRQQALEETLNEIHREVVE
ncbi:hypothetical protein [Natronococcus sp.]|uniref:hypothetical protein n=1 Tax=Natronococcus sp. TaxID=35747 RepID=UPI003A4E243E